MLLRVELNLWHGAERPFLTLCCYMLLNNSVRFYLTRTPMKTTSQQLLDRVDERDRVIGQVSRHDALRVGANFRVAHLFLFNSRSEILLQQLALSRPRHPGCWGSSVAAYVASGENYRQAIERRTREELGVGLEGLKRVCKTSMPEEGGTKFITLFTARSDGPFKVDSGHISKLRSLPPADLLRIRRSEPWTFTPTLVQLLDRFYGREV